MPKVGIDGNRPLDELSGQIAADMQAVAAGNPGADVIERLSTDAGYNAQLRTTCVATMLRAGHAENALPQSANATVNCRILPSELGMFAGAIGAGHLMIDQIVADPAVVPELTGEPASALARAGRALVKVNCAALPTTLVESKLFGREKSEILTKLDDTLAGGTPAPAAPRAPHEGD